MTRRIAHALAVWLCAAAIVALTTTASAQSQTSILVVRAPRVPSSLQREVQRLFTPLGEIVSDKDYAKEARRMRLSAHEQEAIVALLPGLGISLVVTIETITRDAGRYLRLSYRSPETGDEVVKDELPYRGGPLPSSYSNWITSQARLALSTLSSRAPRTQPARPSSAAQAWRNRARARTQPAPELGDDTPPEFGDSGSNQSTDTPPTTGDDAVLADSELMDDADEEALPPRVLQVDGVVGLGLGQRALTLPYQAGTRLLDVGPFLAVDGAVRTRLRLSDGFQLTLALRYYTSVALTSESTPAAGVSQSVPLRSQRMEVVFGPSFRLSNGETVPWLALYLGYAAQDLRGLIEITIPRYSLSGPLLRVDLRATIAEGNVTLWATPEAQWIAAVDSTLQRLHVSDSGLAVGGEVGVSVRISEQFLFEASYRESHSFLATPEQDGFHDLERLVTTRLVVQR